MHEEKFDYSEVEYVNTHTPVKIECRQCGVVFMQEPASHLADCGQDADSQQEQEPSQRTSQRKVLSGVCHPSQLAED